ncbi:heme ABC exporter ATP-binding protein CcmA [Sphingomonas sp.]|uniref:heme ABC exporter ATP-binding protein CcmA n=1 Tax=Sphingomonas sp. TaxID=28214 RepID=UPI0025E94CC0|nr:heme ABC exporter ATP-binding protein CcmA [Sphingomonas sp.]
MSLIAFDGVTGARGGRTLFENLSFSLGAGDALLVSGPNGTGKSSLLRIAAGLLSPAAGRVVGTAPRGWLGELHALDGDRTLAQALGFWATLDGVRGAVAQALEAAGLAALAQVPVRLLSTGQRRRAAMVPLLAARQPVWLLDEPASGLDQAATARLEALMAAHRAAGGAILLATHQPLALPGMAEVRLG